MKKAELLRKLAQQTRDFAGRLDGLKKQANVELDPKKVRDFLLFFGRR